MITAFAGLTFQTSKKRGLQEKRLNFSILLEYFGGSQKYVPIAGVLVPAPVRSEQFRGRGNFFSDQMPNH